jgi:hypothetical protein
VGFTRRKLLQVVYRCRMTGGDVAGGSIQAICKQDCANTQDKLNCGVPAAQAG